MSTTYPNDIMPFGVSGRVENGDVLTLDQYRTDPQRLVGHQPGIARQALENTVLRQVSHMAAGLAQYIANRYPGGVRDDGDLAAVETGLLSALASGLRWNAKADYGPPALVVGDDGNLYRCDAASGPQTTAGGHIVGAKDPTAHADYWTRLPNMADVLDTPLATAAHAGHVKPGAGTDVDAAGALSVRYGSAAGTACQGNDARLSNARTPTAHKVTHKTGGADALTPADIGALAVDGKAKTAGAADSAAKLATARTLDGVSFDGAANHTHYATCATAAATAAKVAALPGFVLATGARVTVRFTVTNTAVNATLNVNGTGAKFILYRNAAVAAGVLAANRTYEFMYDGSTYQLVGDVLQVGAGLALSAAGVATVRYGTAANTACQGNDARLARGEAFRQAMIGSPMYLPTTTLPDGFMWADGSLAKFADWPELQAKYNAGGFAGMVLAYNASDSDKAAYPGKWVPNAANPTGLFLPRLGNLFFRNWVGGTGNAGKYNQPGLPNIIGSSDIEGDSNISKTSTGALYGTSVASLVRFSPIPSDYYDLQVIGIDASKSNKIYGASSTVMPPSVDNPTSIYLGNHAQYPR